jgi:hypothetical protein
MAMSLANIVTALRRLDMDRKRLQEANADLHRRNTALSSEVANLRLQVEELHQANTEAKDTLARLVKPRFPAEAPQPVAAPPSPAEAPAKAKAPTARKRRGRPPIHARTVKANPEGAIPTDTLKLLSSDAGRALLRELVTNVLAANEPKPANEDAKPEEEPNWDEIAAAEFEDTPPVRDTPAPTPPRSPYTIED